MVVAVWLEEFEIFQCSSSESVDLGDSLTKPYRRYPGGEVPLGLSLWRKAAAKIPGTQGFKRVVLGLVLVVVVGRYGIMVVVIRRPGLW